MGLKIAVSHYALSMVVSSAILQVANNSRMDCVELNFLPPRQGSHFHIQYMGVNRCLTARRS